MNDQGLVPDRLGVYRLLDRIGEGGMGVVYLARDQRHRTVALKVLRFSVAGDPTARRRLAREVETMQRVHSPHVAEVIDADLTGDMPYIVTRFVPGRTLDDLVTDFGPLRGAALAKLACGLADALVAVHAAGVVHRDLKPGNVMLVRDTPVVIDFGIAQGPDATRLTMTGMFMGTPGYLAPEVIEGRPSSEASDVHAWGATVGYAATGRSPFGTGSYETIFYKIVNGRADLSGAPPPLIPLLAAALARDPDHRPPAIALRAQAEVLDPSTLVNLPAKTATAGGAAGPGAAGETRSDVAQAQARAAATVWPGQAAAGAVAAGSAAAGSLVPGEPQTVTANGAGSAAALAAADGAQAAAALRSPATRPLATGQPLPDDLRDVLTPVRYERGPAGKRGPGTATAPAAEPPAAPEAAGGKQRAARTGWHPVLVLASMVVAASVSVVLPVAGTLAALGLFAALRTAGLVQRRSAARRLARGTRATDPLVTAMTLPWFLIRALLALILLAPFALAAAAVAAGVAVAAAPSDWPYRALAYAAGTLVIFYGLGPGSRMPRTQLRRIFGTITRTPTAQVVVLFGMTVLAVAALTAAVTWPSAYWPAAIPRGFIHFGVIHFVPLRHRGFLGQLHHVRLLPGIVPRHFG